MAEQPDQVKPAPKKRSSWLALLSTAAIGYCVLYAVAGHGPINHWRHKHKHQHQKSGGANAAAQCAQVEPLWPTLKTSNLDHMDTYFTDSKYLNESIARLAGAIQIPTQSYDDMGEIGTDKRWDVMYDFASYLEKTFPQLHKSLSLEKVNTHGLLYTWEGSDASLKPTVLMGHQDVVPVDESTVAQWEQPPWSGAYDGKYIWGRGSMDCKNTVIGIMEAIEALLESGFQPKRTVVLSFGFDEEISGGRGARQLAATLLKKYGKDGVATIVDEGMGLTSLWGKVFALPGVGEKGYIDINIVVRMPGGHSSIPPPHTGIGVMSELVTLIEANPYEPKLYPHNPFLGTLQCGAAHAPEFPKKLKKLVPHANARGKVCAKKSGKLEQELTTLGPIVQYMFTTSQAIDVIGGGVKVNALPERTTLLVNHRVNIGDKPDDVQQHVTKLAAIIAKKYNLELNAFNGKADVPSSITITHRPDVLSPAPVTPTSVEETTPYSILSGTTRALYGKDIIMAPSIMGGNTDTRYYWDLTKHIFRYGPGWDKDDADLPSAHTVNEKISAIAHLRTIQWFALFLRNIDETKI